MSFDTLEMSLTVLEQLAPLEAKLRQRRKSLADEIGRAAESVALNVSERGNAPGSIAPICFGALRVRRASSPRGFASRGRAATSRLRSTLASRWRSIGSARCCGG